jgi:hypothetical protein
LRKNVKKQFMVNRQLTDPTVIEKCREDAIRGISNYLIFRASMIAQQQKKQQDAAQAAGVAGAGAETRNIFEEAKAETAAKAAAKKPATPKPAKAAKTPKQPKE